MIRLAAQCAVVAAMALTPPNSSSIAQVSGENKTVPDSLDPLLRVLPMERERNRPQPTPGLQFPTKPGFQTVVMHDFGAAAGASDIARPVLLYVPSRFYRRTSEHPLDVWALNFLLFWPGLTPLQDHAECLRSACDGTVIMEIKLTSSDMPLRRYQNLLDRIKSESGKTDAVVAYEPAATISGFAESYQTVVKNPTHALILREQFFVSRRNDGKIVSFSDCSIDTPKPRCESIVKSDADPDITISYHVSMELFLYQNVLLQRQMEDFVKNLVDKKL